jgi:hypothetical protein
MMAARDRSAPLSEKIQYSSCRRRVRPEVTPGSSLDVDECCDYLEMFVCGGRDKEEASTATRLCVPW